MATDAPSRKRRDLKEITQLINEFNDSDLTAAQFAKRKRVSVATVYLWKRKALDGDRSQCRAGLSPVEMIATALPPITPPSSQFIPHDHHSGIHLRFPQGVECHIEASFDRNALAQIVAVLQESSN